VKRCAQRNGFTLLEILTALTIFLIIISVVYGSYISTTRSVDRCQTKITQAQEARSILTNMSRQLRCCYAPQYIDQKLLSNEFPPILPELQQTPMVIFESQSRKPGGIILQFNTTAVIHPISQIPNGLASVTYKYDFANSTLYFRQQIFAQSSQFPTPPSEWKVLGNHVTDIKLNFLNGDKWLDTWAYRENQMLPKAVKIILYLSNNSPPAEYSTIVPIAVKTNNHTLSNNEKS